MDEHISVSHEKVLTNIWVTTCYIVPKLVQVLRTSASSALKIEKELNATSLKILISMVQIFLLVKKIYVLRVLHESVKNVLWNNNQRMFRNNILRLLNYFEIKHILE